MRPRTSMLTRSSTALITVALAAVVMGLPTLRGGFVGGDDHRLLLNHVLVNHPSLSHAAELFTIYHRDLYQPLPLLSFQAEFAIANLFGLFDRGVEAGTWLFHLTNVLLHAINSVLVWLLMRRLHMRRCSRTPPANSRAHSLSAVNEVTSGPQVIATLVALLFAVHPLQMEVIAWTNGRMMLLSTGFALASMIAWSRWLDSRKTGLAALTVAFVILCAISKVRVGLPILLLIVAWAHHAKLSRSLVVLWLICSITTGVFALVNIKATAGAELFSQGAEHLTGPRVVRIAMALAWYFQHLVWPSGLASYYPTPPHVEWSDALSWDLLGVLSVSCIVLCWVCWRSRVARLGVLWFFATIASTLPLVPARNILAADRYMYLPILGLFWLIADFAYGTGFRAFAGRSSTTGRVFAVGVAVILIPLMIGTGWHVASFYETPLKKTSRVADLFPETPRVWEKVGWCHYSLGRYEEAIDYAKRELVHDARSVKSGALQLMGMAAFKSGRIDRALSQLRQAIDIDPNSALGKYRLAVVYDELGRPTDAVPWFEQAIKDAPLHNPTIIRLASVYRSLGRLDDARRMYARAIENNRHEVPAVMSLAEMDIKVGTPKSLAAAERRLRKLLSWMPENTEALTNLGATLVGLDREREATEAYRQALQIEPYQPIAALNLGQLCAKNGDAKTALHLFDRALAGGLADLDRLAVVHDFFLSQAEPERSVALWLDWLDRHPDSAQGRARLIWSLALAGKTEEALQQAEGLSEGGPASPLNLAAHALLDLIQDNHASAVSRVTTLSATGAAGKEARQWMLSALEQFDQNRPNVPWTFCLAAELLGAQGERQLARLSIEFCEQRCRDEPCRRHVEELKEKWMSRSAERETTAP